VTQHPVPRQIITGFFSKKPSAEIVVSGGELWYNGSK
jgi:hypothetical protein